MHEWDEDPSAIDEALRYLRERLEVPKDPRWGAAYLPNVAAQIEGSITHEPIGVGAALKIFSDVVLPACRPNDSPRMLSYVPTAPTIEAKLLDAVLGSVSIFGSHWEAGAGAIAAENEALAYLARLIGFSPDAGGVFVSGGSMANLSALVTARFAWRRAHVGVNLPRLRIAATTQAHASLAAAAHVMDVEIATIPNDDSGRMDVDYLERLLEADSRSQSIFCVVATAGTTSVGVIDRLADIASLTSNAGVWLHVDGAYGAAALCTNRRPLFNGIESADSVTIDPHKWLFAPYDCAALVYREPEVASAAHAQRANYLDHVDRSQWNPSDYAFHLSRRARGLPFWFSLVANGTDAYATAIEATCELAGEFAAYVAQSPHLQLRAEPELSIVLFERRGWVRDQYLSWSSALAESGVALVNPIDIDGRTFARVCLVNPLTNMELLTSIADSMVEDPLTLPA